MKGKDCRIARMLKEQKRHISFHTPGHKKSGADITELSYSDNLLSPSGVIAQAEEEIATVLGAEKSFILTDGATCGIHAMLCALKAAGAQSVAFSAFSHKSVKEGCALLGLNAVEISGRKDRAIPLQPTQEQIKTALSKADALLLTSPDYYGNFPPLEFAKALCKRENKPLLIDGAHGSHLHFCKEYAGNYADMWVDSVHKSLPALTQGAVVSANGVWTQRLAGSVSIFRTTSPSYPIMASVEYAVKYPRNEKIEVLARKMKEQIGAVQNEDWSKILIAFGNRSAEAQEFLERRGVYPEFNDGNYCMFYLSPLTKPRHLKKLARLVKKLPRGEVFQERGDIMQTTGKTVWLPLGEGIGKRCAQECGLFPPCLPLVQAGEVLTKENAKILSEAKSTFGLSEGKILVYSEEQ